VSKGLLVRWFSRADAKKGKVTVAVMDLEAIFSAGELVVGILGLVVAVASLVYAKRVRHEKEEREKLVQVMLATIAGNIVHIRESPGWADRHFAHIRDQALQLQDSDQKAEIIRSAQDGSRDAVAAQRMLSDLLNVAIGLQQGLFDTESIRHPEKRE
jgi:hypothetical protein